MKNVTISLPEDVLEAHRQRAADNKLSLNKWLRELLTEAADIPTSSPTERFLAVVREIGPAPKSWKWNRQEMYDEIMKERGIG